MLIDLERSPELVGRLADAGLIGRKAPGQGARPYLIDTRDSVSSAFRSIAADAIDAWRAETGELPLAAVASSGTLLAALWAGRTGQPFWNALVKGARTRGLRRDMEPDVGVAGQRFALLDNHARSGCSLRSAISIIERHGGEVAAIGVFTAGDDVDIDRPVHVFLPHRLVMEHFS